MKFTSEQRLIVLMLTDIQKALNVEGKFDPEFIAKVTAWKQEFAISFEHGVPFDDQDLPESFTFVINVLDMWTFIERTYKKLDSAQRIQLAERVGISDEDPKFGGFDGTSETELVSHCRLLVDDLRRYGDLKGRDFNSHSPRAGRYAAMLAVFEPIRPQLAGRKMVLDELVSVLSAK